MGKLINIDVGLKQRLKNNKAKNRRFYSSADMSIIKHDIAVTNARRKRGEQANDQNQYISACGCGATGCFIHSQFKTTDKDFYR